MRTRVRIPGTETPMIGFLENGGRQNIILPTNGKSPLLYNVVLYKKNYLNVSSNSSSKFIRCLFRVYEIFKYLQLYVRDIDNLQTRLSQPRFIFLSI